MTERFGYIMIGVLLGIMGTGLVLISAQSPYAGIGSVGIRGMPDGTIYIPANIQFRSDGGSVLELSHQNTEYKIVGFPMTNGSALVLTNETSIPDCDETTNGLMYVDSILFVDVLNLCYNGDWLVFEALS